jgi:hypothetical protein
MINFRFKIGKAFLEVEKYRHHPITIPRAHYEQLVQESLDEDSVSIVSPYGTMSGKIIFGYAGFGKFHQIQMFDGHAGDPMTKFKLAEQVVVEVARTGNGIRVTISYA